MAEPAGFYPSPAAVRALAKLTPEAAAGAVGEAVKGFATNLVVMLKVQATQKLHNPTGNYRRAWMAFPAASQLVIQNASGYAKCIEDGTRPHEILPRRKPFLAWRTGGRGPVSAFRAKRVLASGRPGALASKNWIFTTKGVNHPGTRAYKVFDDVWKAQAPHFGRYLLPEIKRALGFA